MTIFNSKNVDDIAIDELVQDDIVYLYISEGFSIAGVMMEFQMNIVLVKQHGDFASIYYGYGTVTDEAEFVSAGAVRSHGQKIYQEDAIEKLFPKFHEAGWRLYT